MVGLGVLVRGILDAIANQNIIHIMYHVLLVGLCVNLALILMGFILLLPIWIVFFLLRLFFSLDMFHQLPTSGAVVQYMLVYSPLIGMNLVR